MMTARRPGIVLPVVICGLVLIELLAIATLALAWQEAALSRERAAGVHALLAGRSALAHWTASPHSGIQSLAPGARVSFPPESTGHVMLQTELERMSGSLFVLRTTAQWLAGSMRSEARLALLVNGLDPGLVMSGLPAALTVVNDAVLAGSARIDALGADHPPDTWAAQACPAWPVLADSTAGIAARPDTPLTIEPEAVVQGAPRVELRDLPMFAAFDALPADRSETGELDLVPAYTGGFCTTSASGNWGAPLDAGHPCADYFPFIRAEGSLELRAGAGQGTLLVNGDLVLSRDVRFVGVVVVRGRLTLAPNARITGAAWAQSAALDSASIERSNCAAARALLSAPAFNRLAARKGRAWIPVF